MGSFQISAVATTLVCASLGAVGCAGQNDRTRQQLEALEDRIAILQNERDRLDERLSALEQQQQVLVSAAANQPQAAAERPPLRVIRLSPQAAPAPEATGERVLISGSGTRLTTSTVADPASAAPLGPAGEDDR